LHLELLLQSARIALTSVLFKHQGTSRRFSISIRRIQPRLTEMGKTRHNVERRNARRFDVGWAAVVKGQDQSGWGFDERATLKNLSSAGAFLYLARKINLGERLELLIRVPFKKNNWMKYTAEVVRLEPTSARSGIGLRFDTPVPVFISR
jgi:hypothetical protein